jgi:hypothetical protein
MADLYIDSAPVPGDPGVTEITAHQIGVGRLRRSENMDEWVLSPVFPLDFETVTFWDEADKREAIQSAKGWIENHILTERDDLDDLFE